MTLYNCRHSGDEYRITKFTADMEVESSYLCTEIECECPAGTRPTCRHRQMLPKFIHRGHIDDDWFFDFDRGGWVQWDISPVERTFPLPAPLPPSITVLSMDEGPAAIYNAIAEAVGEPTIPTPSPKSVTIRRRV